MLEMIDKKLARESKLLFLIFSVFLLSLYSTTILAAADKSAESGYTNAIGNVPNPGTDLWREIVQSTPRVVLRPPTQPPYKTTSRVNKPDSTILVSIFGEQWRQIRMDKVIPIAGIALLGMLGLLALFYLIRGKILIRAGISPKLIKRYTGYERFVHWSMAICFILLALTGMVLLFGRNYLIPLIGKQANADLAMLAKTVHDYIGPVFIFFLVLMFLKFVIRNIYARGDLTWLLRGGGIIGKKHVPSGFFNMGEKSLFWILVIVGGIISATGVVLDFPNLNLMREVMVASHLLHSISGMLMFTIVLGHIYIGSIGMEGAFDAMKTGYCDLNWAKEHHENWAEDCEREQKIMDRSEVRAATGK